MRADSDIKKDVEDQLRLDGGVDAGSVVVTAHRGVVMLNGFVRGYYQKIHAERIAGRVAGALNVANDIRVRLPYINKRSDLEIAGAAIKKLQEKLPYSSQFVNVTVRDAWLTLEGTLEWNYQRDRAIRAVCAVIGVIGVSSKIIIEQPVAESGVKRKIEEFLKRSAELDAQRAALESARFKVTVGCEGGRNKL